MLSTWINWIVRTYINDRLEPYLDEPLQTCTVSFSPWSGVLSLSTEQMRLQPLCERYHIVLDGVGITVPCYDLRNQSIRIDASSATVHRREPVLPRSPLSTEPTIIDFDQDNDPQDDIWMTTETADVTMIDEKQAALQDLFLGLLQNIRLNIENVTLHWDAQKTFIIQGVRDIPSSAYSVHIDQVLLQGHQSQSLVNYPGIDVRWDQPLGKLLVHIRGGVQFALHGSDSARRWGLVGTENDSEDEGDEDSDTSMNMQTEYGPSWLHVLFEQSVQLTTVEDSEYADRVSAAVVQCTGCGHANGQPFARAVQLLHGDVCVRIKGFSGSSVRALDVFLKDKRVASIRDIAIHRRRMHILIDGARQQLRARTTPSQTAALVNAVRSLCTHLSVMFPLEIPGVTLGSEEADGDETNTDEDDDGVGEELVLVVDGEDAQSNDSRKNNDSNDSRKSNSSAGSREKRPKRVPMPPRHTCPIYVHVRNVCVAWTLCAEDGSDNKVQMCALIIAASYRQCDYPTGDFESLHVQNGWRAVIKDWEVRDDVKHSHWRCLLACGGTLDAPATVLQAVQKTCYAPTQSHAVQMRLRTRPVRICVHQATYDFLERYVGSMSNALTRATADGKPDAAIVLERLDVERVRFVVDYKPQTSTALTEMLRTTDFVYLLRSVPVEGATLRLRPVHLCNVPVDQLSERLMALYVPNWHKFVAAYVRGVQPVHVALRLGKSVFNLVKVPIKEFKKGDEGDVWGALHDGVRTVTVELLRLGTRASTLSYKALRGADRMLESNSSRQRRKAKEEKEEEEKKGGGKAAVSLYASQPASFADGAHDSWQYVRSGVSGGVGAVTREPYRAYQRGGAKSLVSATARGVPRLVLQPAMGITGAMTRLTQATCNVVDPTQKEEADKHWKQ